MKRDTKYGVRTEQQKAGEGNLLGKRGGLIKGKE